MLTDFSTLSTCCMDVFFKQSEIVGLEGLGNILLFTKVIK
jgi:hypothetical protein